MALHLHTGGNVPTPAGEMAATKHVRCGRFGYSCILASMEINVTGHQTLQLGYLVQEGPFQWKMYFLLWFSLALS